MASRPNNQRMKGEVCIPSAYAADLDPLPAVLSDFPKMIESCWWQIKTG